jgi:hypothetical protein
VVAAILARAESWILPNVRNDSRFARNREKTRDAQRGDCGGIHGGGDEAAATAHCEVRCLHQVALAGDFGPEVFVGAGHEWKMILF